MGFVKWLLNVLGCREDLFKQLYVNSLDIIDEIRDENKLLKKQLEEYKIWEDEEMYIKAPSWLDTSIFPYKPFVSIEEGKFHLDDPRDIYTSSRTLAKIARKWRKIPYDQRLMTIWYFVIDALKYAYDVYEDWQFPQVTYYRKYGDCEDGTILFVTLCRLAGIHCDKVFNACGYYKSGSTKYGHSFPIAQMSDGKWYIFETTLDWHPRSPILFKGSNYDASWGLCNWAYYGKIKNGDQI